MKANVLYGAQYTVYPGEYTPMPEVEHLLSQLNLRSSDSPSLPPLNMAEFDNYFKINVVTPGARREDIFIHVNEGILSMIVLHNQIERSLSSRLQMHELDSKSLIRRIALPENADVEFATAEYRQGILTVVIPKTTNPSNAGATKIVIY